MVVVFVVVDVVSVGCFKASFLKGRGWIACLTSSGKASVVVAVGVVNGFAVVVAVVLALPVACV